jgi:hypothetical protein
MVNLDTSAPMTVPIAAQTASPNKAMAHKPMNLTCGKPTNTGVVRTTDKAKGQIRRGLRREAIPAPTQAPNAMSAANGKTKNMEKSIAESYQVKRQLTTLLCHWMPEG